ncbi:MAG: type I methionyl aminopeptidase [Leptospirales bacterium]|nr:type I methionyl aminopeptidase [Leptospirales bacterium]
MKHDFADVFGVRLKSADDIKRIADAGRIISELFVILREEPLVAVSTWEIDSEIDGFLLKKKARSAFKTIKGYDYASCISINEETVHGIPHKKRRIREGDLVKIDVGVSYNGYFADACLTLGAGKIAASDMKLMECAKAAVDGAIAAIAPQAPISAIGDITEKIALADGYSVAANHAGHGTGFALHEPPLVPHFKDSGISMPILVGMVLAVEPVICAGNGLTVISGNGWTAVTADNSQAAQFEHTVAITEEGVKVLTA